MSLMQLCVCLSVIVVVCVFPGVCAESVKAVPAPGISGHWQEYESVDRLWGTGDGVGYLCPSVEGRVLLGGSRRYICV